MRIKLRPKPFDRELAAFQRGYGKGADAMEQIKGKQIKELHDRVRKLEGIVSKLVKENASLLAALEKHDNTVVVSNRWQQITIPADQKEADERLLFSFDARAHEEELLRQSVELLQRNLYERVTRLIQGDQDEADQNQAQRED